MKSLRGMSEIWILYVALMTVLAGFTGFAVGMLVWLAYRDDL